METVLFDLDMTLLDSSNLEQYRLVKDWTSVRANLGDVSSFEYEDDENVPRYVHELPRFFHDQGLKVGIVTSSPRWYAESLIETFGIYTDTLVASGDTHLGKPFGDPIKKALTNINARADRAVYVGDSVDDTKAAYLAKVLSIGTSWGSSGENIKDYFSQAPEIFVVNPKYLKNLDDLMRRRYLGECLVKGDAPLYHKGSRILVSKAPMTFALGRYFPAADPRRANCRYSDLIEEFKKDGESSELFVSASKLFLDKIKWFPDIVLAVPPKPDQKDRFEKFLAATIEALGGNAKSGRGILKCNEAVENYKSLGHFERRKQIKGTFEVVGKVYGKVLVVDDVLSTGSTFNEVYSVLRDSGADEVRCLAFGLNQFPPFEEKICSCGARMKIRKSQYGKFWGCSTYPTCKQVQKITYS